MGDNVDVKALRARFSSSTSASHTSSRDSNSPKSPRRGVGRAMPSTPEKDIFRPKMSPTVLPHVAAPDVAMVAPFQSVPVLFPHSPSHTGVREVVQSSRGNKIKQTGEMLENLMLKGAAGTKVPLPAPRLTALPPPRLRSAIDVIPLRKPLPPDGPLPLKPKRPHNVDLEQFFNIAQRARPLPASGTREGSETRQISLSGVTSTPNPPSQLIDYRGLQNQVTSVEVDIYHDDYDDIANLEDQDDYDDLSSEDFPPPPPPPPDISVDAIVEKELRKKFKYEGPLRVLQTVMINPNGVMKKPGKKDLHVSPGDVVDIIQLTNSKKALCHNRRSGNCGYVSRKLLVRLTA
ncbi:PML-RARA-regulated adapter molecule 1 isoform X2 [Hippocampus comes]|uniref:PML-RARA-regulated adapter molecule 1 isoform X2 n=1 Tax=Hippocampus comes TaxID=109280 RepID=UPI00094E9921|nr:PREDICTED: PML-RARA-regulated adapter molecule 1-like isoform X2 [Hippocampus comes]